MRRRGRSSLSHEQGRNFGWETTIFEGIAIQNIVQNAGDDRAFYLALLHPRHSFPS